MERIKGILKEFSHIAMSDILRKIEKVEKQQRTDFQFIMSAFSAQRDAIQEALKTLNRSIHAQEASFREYQKDTGEYLSLLKDYIVSVDARVRSLEKKGKRKR